MTPTFRRPETCFKYCVLACTYPRRWREREEPFAGTRTWIFLRARHPEDKRVDKLEKWIRIFSNFISDGFKDDILQPVGASKTVFTRRTAKVDKFLVTGWQPKKQMEHGIEVYLAPSFCQCFSWVLVQLPRAELVKIASPAFPPQIAKGVASTCFFSLNQKMLFNKCLWGMWISNSVCIKKYKMSTSK